MKIRFFETSAKINENVSEVFIYLTMKILKNAELFSTEEGKKIEHNTILNKKKKSFDEIII